MAKRTISAAWLQYKALVCGLREDPGDCADLALNALMAKNPAESNNRVCSKTVQHHLGESLAWELQKLFWTEFVLRFLSFPSTSDVWPRVPRGAFFLDGRVNRKSPTHAFRSVQIPMAINPTPAM